MKFGGYRRNINNHTIRFTENHQRMLNLMLVVLLVLMVVVVLLRVRVRVLVFLDV